MNATTSMTWTAHSVAAQSLVDQAQHCLLQVIGLTDDLRIELGALSGLARATADRPPSMMTAGANWPGTRPSSGEPRST